MTVRTAKKPVTRKKKDTIDKNQKKLTDLVSFWKDKDTRPDPNRKPDHTRKPDPKENQSEKTPLPQTRTVQERTVTRKSSEDRDKDRTFVQNRVQEIRRKFILTDPPGKPQLDRKLIVTTPDRKRKLELESCEPGNGRMKSPRVHVDRKESLRKQEISLSTGFYNTQTQINSPCPSNYQSEEQEIRKRGAGNVLGGWCRKWDSVDVPSVRANIFGKLSAQRVGQTASQETAELIGQRAENLAESANNEVADRKH